MESDILPALLVISSFILGISVGGWSACYFLKYKNNKEFLSKATRQIPITLTSLIGIKIQYKSYEKQVKAFRKPGATFTPIECNSFAYISIELDPPLQNNKELAMYAYAYIENLKVIARVTQRTYANTKEIKEQFENNNINKHTKQ